MLAPYMQVMSSPAASGSSGIPVYVWAIIGAVGVGVLVALVLAVVIFVKLRTKNNKVK